MFSMKSGGSILRFTQSATPTSGKAIMPKAFEGAGFDCETPIKNTGAGAAMMRVEAAGRIFPRCWFNEKTTEAGRESRRMPQHVDMQGERQPSSLASPLNHASNAHPAERLATLIDEDVGPLGPVSPLLPMQELETIHLIPL
jgi:hypothetical protein